ncbi:hypothetical protein CHS0354_011728 [Potamilus streckersoni]|uniref:Codanin-1 C-terminal domain-containing protein n=1 Tax=Potamilus streckersoni TaxID=2493646 RepID=A0AAE0SK92_9BIVA|nr:hypothetical protein CHS0354_011728 [Potamilus streckersoni]
MDLILESVYTGKIFPDHVVSWIKGNINKRDAKVPERLRSCEDPPQEFIPFFLNYLRDHTLHLLQCSKSTTPSPAKTPSIQRLKKTNNCCKTDNRKRLQLFGSSPANDTDDTKQLSASVFSPNSSHDSSSVVTSLIHGTKTESFCDTSKATGQRSFIGYNSPRISPRCGSQRVTNPHRSFPSPEHFHSRHKLSLGEFIHTPDFSSSHQKRKSPHSGGKRDRDKGTSISPSNSLHRRPGDARRRGTQSSPLLHDMWTKQDDFISPSPPPVFSLASVTDFPPMDLGKSQISTNDVQSNHNNSNQYSIHHDKKDCDKRDSSLLNFSPSEANSLQQTLFQDSRKDKSVLIASHYKEHKMTTPVCLSNKVKNSKRRITPTLLKPDAEINRPQNTAFLAENGPTWQSKPSVKNDTRLNLTSDANENLHNLEFERSLLRLEKAKIQQETPSKTDARLSSVTPTKSVLEHSSSFIEMMEALSSEVTNQDKLELLVQLYCACLEANLMPNLVVELYFLTQLLTARGSESTASTHGDDIDEKNLFSSVHNAVYFAVSSFEKERRWLCMLDRGTLRLLSENQRIHAFSPDLQHFLEKTCEEFNSGTCLLFSRSPIGTVSFQADTDNRCNFPSDKSFHVFKRQRDGFYELIREWEERHHSTGWNMMEMMGHRIRALISDKTELANYIHFARLFQSQLIETCKEDGSQRKDGEEENIALIRKLKRTNPEKFKRLQERFIKPMSFGGPCPSPSFPGCQEFFRDFITAACNPTFNQHLLDTLAAKVIELNNTQFFCSEDGEEGYSENENGEEKDMFVSTLLTSRLLAKFLGFVTFLPYQSTEKLPDNMESSYVAIRNQQKVPIDLVLCLRTSVTQGRVSITLPWIVEYLSMMDFMAPHLDYYQLLLFLLLHLHRMTWEQLQVKFTFSHIMVVTLSSWLFSIPVIPEGLFASEIPENVQDLILNDTSSALDMTNFVDQSLFYICCPFIGEIKMLLVEFAVDSNSKASTIKKITPISADLQPVKGVNEKQLQLQMEENFFHNHPASLKRVVDFVADRTASNFIKKFRFTWLQQSIAEGKEKLLEVHLSKSEGSSTGKMKDRMIIEIGKIAQEQCLLAKNSAFKERGSYCQSRIPNLMKLLLPDDQSDIVIDTAEKISACMAEEKIVSWMNKHINPGMFQNEFQSELDKLNKTMLLQQKTEHRDLVLTSADPPLVDARCANEHCEDIRHPSDVLIDLKDTVKDAILNGKKITKEKLISLMKEIEDTLCKRQDILPGVLKAFTRLIVDLLLYLMCFQPEFYSDEMISVNMSLWRDPTLALFFSGRVVHMLETSPDPQGSWQRYNGLLVTLVNGNILQLSDMQTVFLKLLVTFTKQDTLVRIGYCLCELAEKCTLGLCSKELGECFEVACDVVKGKNSELTQRIMCIRDKYESLTAAHCESYVG